MKWKQQTLSDSAARCRIRQLVQPTPDVRLSPLQLPRRPQRRLDHLGHRLYLLRHLLQQHEGILEALAVLAVEDGELRHLDHQRESFTGEGLVLGGGGLDHLREDLRNGLNFPAAIAGHGEAGLAHALGVAAELPQERQAAILQSVSSFTRRGKKTDHDHLVQLEVVLDPIPHAEILQTIRIPRIVPVALHLAKLDGHEQSRLERN